MTRPIKFRVYNKENNQIYYHALVDVLAYDVGIDMNEQIRGENILMQFTGLLDKNGKEIYEGDIFGYDNSGERKITNPVVWNEKMLWYEINDGVMLWAIRKDAEVIGNIYENPDLIKK